MKRCSTCKALGYQLNGSYVKACPGCNGRGFIHTVYKKCIHCDGTGTRLREKCAFCAGKGYTNTVMPMSDPPTIVPLATLREAWHEMNSRELPKFATRQRERGDYVDVKRLLKRRKTEDLYSEPHQFAIGVLAALWTLLGHEQRLLRTLSQDGNLILDGTGIWIEDDDLTVRLIEYEGKT
jgi:hypothetical protein